MDIFALSLFDSAQPPLIKLSTHRNTLSNDLSQGIQEILETGATENGNAYTLLSWARFMVGHVFEDEDIDYVIIVDKGQAVFPTIFESYRIEKNGYLCLTALPGTLNYQGDTYNTVTAHLFPEDQGSTGQHSHTDHSPPIYPIVSVPLNLFSKYKVSWKIHIQSDTELRSELTVRSNEGIISGGENPTILLEFLDQAFMLEGCPHDSRAQLAPPDTFCAYSSPFGDHSAACNSTSFVDVVAVDRADDLRFFSLRGSESDSPVVFRRDACIACCLAFCRNAGGHILIL